jgi:hypothetical protein
LPAKPCHLTGFCQLGVTLFVTFSCENAKEAGLRRSFCLAWILRTSASSALGRFHVDVYLGEVPHA